MNYRRFFRRAFAAALSVGLMLTLGACSMLRFNSPEEIKQQEEELAAIAALHKSVSAESMVADDLVFAAELRSDAGVLLAAYSARVPQFSVDGGNSASFAKINEYYAQEFESFEPDCASFFDMIKAQYGDDWAARTAETISQDMRISYDMHLLGSEYISFTRTYTVTDGNGRQNSAFYAEIFSAQTGWRLRFSDLFGKHEEEALSVLSGLLTDWCAENGVAADSLTALGAEELTGEVAVSDSEFLLCVKPYALSKDDVSGRIIRLPIESLLALME